ncbi:MAG: ribonuclease H-like domain-containing protein [Planctomycetota bacterium]|nr:ribonuclease H-like domain-containing protein [Planctomycetota bacterium]
MVAPDRERLKRAFGKAGREAPPAAQGEGVGEVRRFLQRRRAERPVVELPEGEVVTNPQGSCWRRLLRYPMDHRHGSLRVGDASKVDWSSVAALAREEQFAEQELGECLFVDTETTGLGGGAGTVVFVIGMGWFESDAFVLEQLFLRNFAEEPACLQHMAERLAVHPVPVSFVGKSFDRHRIAARLAVHAMKAPILTQRHLDLYYLARRAWRDELENHRLRTVEEQRLGVFRRDDLPGSEAPVAFMDWIRDGTGPVDRVLEHNRIDVLSLATLLARLGAAAT